MPDRLNIVHCSKATQRASGLWDLDLKLLLKLFLILKNNKKLLLWTLTAKMSLEASSSLNSQERESWESWKPPDDQHSEHSIDLYLFWETVSSCCHRVAHGDKSSQSNRDNDSTLLNKLILITVASDYGKDFSGMLRMDGFLL